MFLIDDLLIGGLRFVLDKIAAAAEQELSDDERLREELLAAGMRVELGEMSKKEYAKLERDILARMRAIRELREEQGAAVGIIGTNADVRVTGVEATVAGDEEPPR